MNADLEVIHTIALKDNRIFDLQNKVKEIRKTLEWYADLSGPYWGELGERARQTLKSIEGKLDK